MFFSILKLLIRQPAQERAQHEADRSELLSCVSADDRVEPDSAARGKMLAGAHESVRRLLAEPASSSFSDHTFYSRGVLGFVVCGRVDAVNCNGAVVSNYFVSDLLPSFRPTASELFPSDPRLKFDDSTSGKAD